MYTGFWFKPCLSRSLSQSDGFNKYNSEILRQSPFVLPSCITYTLGGFAKEFFLVFHLKSVGGKTQIKLSPFPHVFGLRRLQSNPPRSLWLQHIHWMCCLTRRAHTAVPPWKGTHGVRSAWGHTQHSHRWASFHCYVTALCAPATQQHGAVACTTHTRAPARQKQAN